MITCRRCLAQSAFRLHLTADKGHLGATGARPAPAVWKHHSNRTECFKDNWYSHLDSVKYATFVVFLWHIFFHLLAIFRKTTIAVPKANYSVSGRNRLCAWELPFLLAILLIAIITDGDHSKPATIIRRQINARHSYSNEHGIMIVYGPSFDVIIITLAIKFPIYYLFLPCPTHAQYNCTVHVPQEHN